MAQFTFTIVDDKPYPYCTGFLINGESFWPRQLKKLPDRIKSFLGLVFENECCIRVTSIDSTAKLRKELGKKEDYGDVKCTFSTPKDNIVNLMLSYHIPPPEPRQLKRTWNDGAHRGVDDWYEPLEHALKNALKRKLPWTTGWYGSKHESMSANITYVGDNDLLVEVSVSDDFDTPGRGSATIAYDTATLDSIREALEQASDEAEESRKDNRQHALFCVGKRNGRKHRGHKRINWIYTYVANVGDMDEPPGDNYHKWGWQESLKGIPKADRLKLTQGIESFQEKTYAGDWVAELSD